MAGHLLLKEGGGTGDGGQDGAEVRVGAGADVMDARHLQPRSERLFLQQHIYLQLQQHIYLLVQSQQHNYLLVQSQQHIYLLVQSQQHIYLLVQSQQHIYLLVQSQQNIYPAPPHPPTHLYSDFFDERMPETHRA